MSILIFLAGAFSGAVVATAAIALVQAGKERNTDETNRE